VMIIEGAVTLIKLKFFGDIMTMSTLNYLSAIFCRFTIVVVTIFCHVAVIVVGVFLCFVFGVLA
jgi:hypothetical protein